MKQIAFIVIAAVGLTLPSIGSAGTTEIRKYLGDKRTCHTSQGTLRTIKTEGRGLCVTALFNARCPDGRCTGYSKPNRYGQCPSGGNLTYCPTGWDDKCGKYTLERLEGEPGKTVCTTERGGYLKSEISYPDEIELREGAHAEIKVKGDCTAITIGSQYGKIIPRETRVCGTGNVQITKQPGAEGADYVEIKAQIVQ
ncbi:Uncharacterised protein [Shigella sonnei]|uniref:hypothetical protein n=1 Tax=Shigella sonnei TaxID=624 RepID=UPI0006644AAA|nr:hypothetical protein [Shigella sonnei]CSQ60319.1 Uncharacterised protein [Shigella sonnei]CSQ81841.1 Uncharacterised protein [Shigella sonnei]